MKQYLNDVVVIRLILIVLLVQYHAFAIYNGAWQMPNGVQSVETYWWIATISYSFLLETFVFVSGYVFGFQVRNNPLGKITAKKCVIKKAKRLLIPSIVFSLVYFICFEREAYISCSSCIYDIINGEGHMWFLPMLFWCFVATFAFEKLRIPCKVVVLLAILASILSLMTLPFRISTAAYYFVFFYTGYYIQRNGLILKDIKGNTVILAGLIFVIVFLVSRIFLDNVLTASFESESSFYKINTRRNAS
jgi:fucose 4-O-acetylase-like acetyltransferase